MNCRICGNNISNREFSISEMMYGYKETFPYFQCSKCNCLQIEKEPEHIERYYSDYYSFNEIEPPNISGRLRLKFNLLLFSLQPVKFIFQHLFPIGNVKPLFPLKLNKSSRILDVGCGSGSMLYLLRDIGFSNLEGIDPNISKEIQYKNGLKIKKQDISEVEKPWDLILFNHSLEHIFNQQQTLNKVKELLSPGGVCIIRIPVISSFAWKTYGVDWVQIDAPRHFYLHSIESFKHLASLAGLNVFKISFDSTDFQFWGSEQYRAGIPLKDNRSYLNGLKNSIFTVDQINRFRKLADKLNREKSGDQAVFYLRKI